MGYLINRISSNNLLIIGLTIILLGGILIFISFITNQRKKEKIRLEKERNFSLLRLVENYTGMVFNCQINDDWTMNYISSNAYLLTGYTSDEVIDNKTISYSEIIHPKYREIIRKAYQKAIKNNEKIVIDYKIITKSKEEKWVREEGNIIYDRYGKAISIDGFVYDISLEKKYIYERNLTELKYSSLIDGISDPVLIVKNVNEIIDLNSAAMYFFNANTKTQILNHSPLELLNENYHELFFSRMERIKKTKTSNIPVNYQFKRFDQTIVDAIINASPFFIDGDLYAHLIIIKQDDKLNSDYQLKINERRNKDLILSMPDGIAVFKIIPDEFDGKLLFANNKFSELVLGSYKDLVDLCFKDIFAEIPLNSKDDIFDQARTSCIRNEHYDLSRKQYFSFIFYFNKESELVVNVSNITQEKLMSFKFQEEKEKLNRLLDAIDTTIWEWNLSEKSVKLDEKTLKILGYESKHQMLKTQDIKELIHPDDFSLLHQKVHNCLLNSNDYFSIEMRVKTEKNKYIWWLIRGNVSEYDGDGKAANLMGTLQDVTRHKEKDEEIIFLSRRDHLTKLYNLGEYHKKIREIDTEENLPISVAIIDVDGLKVFNDSFNHGVGDELLIKTANILLINKREEDILARIGGDEFALVMPRTKLSDASERLSKIQEDLKKETVMNIPISISFGIEEKFNDRFSLTQIKDMADSKMYQQKFSQKDSRLNILENIQEYFFLQYPFERKVVSLVHELSLVLAKSLNFTYEEMKTIDIASQYYNIGIFSIKSNVFNNQRNFKKYAEVEYRKHVENGYRIMQATYRDEAIATAVLHHHEKYNGQGYPGKFKAKEIPLISRIISVLATYARRSMLGNPQKDIINYIITEKNISFDPEIVDAFIKIL